MNWRVVGYQGARLLFASLMGLAMFAMIYWLEGDTAWIAALLGGIIMFSIWWRTP